MSKIGVAISGGPARPEIVDLAVLPSTSGYDSAWIAEGHGGDQFAILAACAFGPRVSASAPRSASVFVRTAPTIAMGSIDGRRPVEWTVHPGLGSSHRRRSSPSTASSTASR